MKLKDDEVEKYKSEKNNEKRLTKVEMQNIKNFLIEEYGVSGNCLEIS